MHKINQNINYKTCADFISSNCITYQGKTLTCVPVTCDNPSLTTIVEHLGDIGCYNYDQLNSISSVSLGTLTSELNCEDKTLLNLFNLSFEQIIKLQNDITLVSTDTPTKIILDFCTPVTYSCTNTCIFEKPCCSADEGQFLTDILQAYAGRLVQLSTQVCNLYVEIADIKQTLIDISNQNEAAYVPPKVTLVNSEYWNGTTYVQAPTIDLALDTAIEFLDVDHGKLKNIVGNASDLLDNRNFKCVDPNDSSIIYHNYISATNSFELQNLIQTYLCNLKLQVNALQLRQEECCKTDCDTCMDNYFTNVRVNYGEVASGVSSTPYITVDHSINTQVMSTCVGNTVSLGNSYYLVSDGSVTKQIKLDTLTGINILSGSIGTSATLQFDLAALGLDYLKDITIKLHVKTALDCVDSYRGLIPRFDNPDCDTCMLCLNKLDSADQTAYTIDFDLNYIGGAFLGYSNHYQLSTSNPCVTLERKVGQTITISNVNNPNAALVQLCSDCDFLGLPSCCKAGSSGSDETPVIADSCWTFNIPASQMTTTLHISDNETPNSLSPSIVSAIDLDVKLDSSKYFTYKKLITYVNPSGETLSGSTLTEYFPTIPSDYNYDDYKGLTLADPGTLPSYVCKGSINGGIIIKWDDAGNVNKKGRSTGNHTPAFAPGTWVLGSNDLYGRNYSYLIEGDLSINLKIQQQPIDKIPIIVLNDPITNNEMWIPGILNNPASNCNCTF